MALHRAPKNNVNTVITVLFLVTTLNFWMIWRKIQLIGRM